MLQAPANRDPVVGAGRGIVDVYDTQGTFKTHLVAAGGQLNARSGLTLAPPEEGVRVPVCSGHLARLARAGSREVITIQRSPEASDG